MAEAMKLSLESHSAGNARFQGMRRQSVHIMTACPANTCVTIVTWRPTTIRIDAYLRSKQSKEGGTKVPTAPGMGLSQTLQKTRGAGSRPRPWTQGR